MTPKWLLMFSDLSLMDESPPGWGCNISMILSHKFIAGMPTIPNPTSRDEMLPSRLLWDTAVCFLQAHDTGANKFGTVPVYSLLLDLQRDSTVCSWLCDESI